MLSDAIQYYHDLLTDAMAQDSQAQLEAQLRRRGLFFGERPLTTVLRPRFLTPEQFDFIQRRVKVLLRAFHRIHEAGIANAEFRRQFRLTEQEEALALHNPGYRWPSPVSRLDSFFLPDSLVLKFNEYNAETPAASAYNDVLSEVFYGLPVMGEFMHRYRVRPLPARPGVLHALLQCYEQWLGRRERPRIAIVDWGEVPTYSEFVLFDEYFRAQGLECRIVDPRHLEYRNGRLSADGFAIDLIYKRVLISELLDWGGTESAMVRAVLDNAVCMVNPFACKLLYKKGSLAVLSDERNAHLFDREEAQAIAEHIPWTRIVEERRTEYQGQPVDLIRFTLDNRERLVLKPNDDYGGKGVVLGWTVDDSQWEAALKVALETPYVVQERVVVPREPYPSLADGRVYLLDRQFDTAPFCYFGEFTDSCLTRLSTEPLLNVTAGGGSTVPTFVVEAR